MCDHFYDLLSLTTRYRDFTPVGQFDIATITPQETFNEFHVYQVRLMWTDEVMVAEQFFVLLQGFRYQYLLTIGKEEIGVIVITLTTDDLVSFNNMYFFRS